MIIKVCGMRDADNIRTVEALGIDWMGFIFWPGSSRYVAKRPTCLPTKVKRVGVFVNAPIDEVKAKVNEYALDIIQLHGHESPDYVRSLRADSGFPAIIKALSITTLADISTYQPYEGLVDYFLFDTKCQTVGGSGRHFDWSVLYGYDGQTPFLLSGGISPDDASDLRTLFAGSGFPTDKCVGIDLNSRFETAPAVKDISALRHFLSQITPNKSNPQKNSSL